MLFVSDGPDGHRLPGQGARPVVIGGRALLLEFYACFVRLNVRQKN
jgi:hypothetical protein